MPTTSHPDAFAMAAQEALGRLRVLIQRKSDLSAEMHQLDKKIRKMEELVESLMSQLPKDKASELAQQLQEEKCTKTVTGKNPVYKAIEEITKEEPETEITRDKVLSRLQRFGLALDPKKIYNSLQYLADSGALKRVGRGKYQVSGGMVVTSDYLTHDEEALPDD